MRPTQKRYVAFGLVAGLLVVSGISLADVGIDGYGRYDLDSFEYRLANQQFQSVTHPDGGDWFIDMEAQVPGVDTTIVHLSTVPRDFVVEHHPDLLVEWEAYRDGRVAPDPASFVVPDQLPDRADPAVPFRITG